jgi:photoactive yellow protein
MRYILLKVSYLLGARRREKLRHQCSSFFISFDRTGKEIYKTHTMNQKDDFIYVESEKIESYTRDEFDALSFGAIKLGKDGIILKYNAYEGRLAGRSPAEVVGKNFFTEVAPCTNVQEFAGRFRDGVDSGKLYATFPYRFLFPGNYVDVEITMMSGNDGQSAWIFVKESGKAV